MNLELEITWLGCGWCVIGPGKHMWDGGWDTLEEAHAWCDKYFEGEVPNMSGENVWGEPFEDLDEWYQVNVLNVQ